MKFIEESDSSDSDSDALLQKKVEEIIADNLNIEQSNEKEEERKDTAEYSEDKNIHEKSINLNMPDEKSIDSIEDGIKKKYQDLEHSDQHILNFIKNIQKKLSEYKDRMHRFQLRQLKGDIETLQDAEDVLFTFRCISSKLKEELTTEEEKLRSSVHIKDNSSITENEEAKSNENSQPKNEEASQSIDSIHAKNISNIARVISVEAPSRKVNIKLQRLPKELFAPSETEKGEPSKSTVKIAEETREDQKTEICSSTDKKEDVVVKSSSDSETDIDSTASTKILDLNKVSSDEA